MEIPTASPGSFADVDLDKTPFIEWSPYYLLLLLIYPLAVALLRHDRLRTTLETFPYTNRRSFASMTDKDAFLIQQKISELEFPFTFEKALQFALFRTYGIPSISKLLVATAQLSEEATSCKRYTDTEVLIQEFIGHAPASRRTLEAINRMNYIHSGYQKSGKISNDDMLYTLSLFVVEPIRWIDRYEWRTLEAFEKCAIGTFWKSLGDAMVISYENLRSANEGWVDGLQWLEEIVAWGEDYEKKYMVPHPSNKKTADQTVNILLWKVPKPLKPAGQKTVLALMDDRLRKAMMYATLILPPTYHHIPNQTLTHLHPHLPPHHYPTLTPTRYPTPPPLYTHFTHNLLALRGFLLRHLFLPRPSFLPSHHLSTHPSPNGTYYALKFPAAPYYVKPTLWQRWGPMAWVNWTMGLPLPGDEGGKYWPGGYRIGEIGPTRVLGKGEGEMKVGVEGLRGRRTGGCVFGVVKRQ